MILFPNTQFNQYFVVYSRVQQLIDDGTYTQVVDPTPDKIFEMRWKKRQQQQPSTSDATPTNQGMPSQVDLPDTVQTTPDATSGEPQDIPVNGWTKMVTKLPEFNDINLERLKSFLVSFGGASLSFTRSRACT